MLNGNFLLLLFNKINPNSNKNMYIYSVCQGELNLYMVFTWQSFLSEREHFWPKMPFVFFAIGKSCKIIVINIPNATLYLHEASHNRHYSQLFIVLTSRVSPVPQGLGPLVPLCPLTVVCHLETNTQSPWKRKTLKLPLQNQSKHPYYYFVWESLLCRWRYFMWCAGIVVFQWQR